MEENSKASFGMKLLCFLIPILGLILFLTNKDYRPIYAKSCGISSIVGVVASFLIPIIILGIYIVFVPGEEPINSVSESLSDIEIVKFNSQFEIYEGLFTGSKVKQLIRTVDNSNIENENQVKIYLDGDKYESSDKISSSSKYDVSFKYDSEGYINRVDIKSK